MSSSLGVQLPDGGGQGRPGEGGAGDEGGKLWLLECWPAQVSGEDGDGTGQISYLRKQLSVCQYVSVCVCHIFTVCLSVHNVFDPPAYVCLSAHHIFDPHRKKSMRRVLIF